MLKTLMKSVFGSRNDRVLKRLQKNVMKTNALAEQFRQLSDEDLTAKTTEFKQRHQQGETLDQLLPEAFAAVREAAERTLQMRHFDVQLIGGMVLHEGNIAEMLTGEGKTLVATLPAYLNALTGLGVHIVTVNEYLARRDAEWMEPVFNKLGLTVGVNVSGMSPTEKQNAYKADITYGTNNEFGFDYLRDNMAFRLSDRAQRELAFAIVDEVDSILIDEARTPLIISGPTDDSSDLYRKINSVIPQLNQQHEEEGEGDYSLDEKAKQAFLTEAGHLRIEQILAEMGLIKAGESLYDASNISLMHHVHAALRAHTLFQRDVDYVVKDDKVTIVDEHTGRLMVGRRWSDGLHQAVEAKEGATIEQENQTLASITFQNYFRNYQKLSGMTGTADTEAYEFHQIYGLEVVVIPPNRSVQRKDHPDKVYLTLEEKFNAIIDEIQTCQQNHQPVLVGTASIETSEFLSKQLTKAKIKHEVLNAKQHEREAHIITEAGRPGAVTIATNMAGRGTDIVLGGNLDAELKDAGNLSDEQIAERKAAWEIRHQQVLEAGGLHVLGTERHESRRIDNQLRGRSGRQGDPGSSRFYLSLQDNLLRIFASERLQALMQRLGVPDGEALESSMLTRVIENAQRKVESHNFDIRKQLLEYDDVANEQRKVIYSQRAELMAEDDVSATIQAMIDNVADHVVHEYIPPESFPEQWDTNGLTKTLRSQFGVECDVTAMLAQESSLEESAVLAQVQEKLHQRYQEQAEIFGSEVMRSAEKSVLLQTLDTQWKDHLAAMDHLRQGIHLRGYAQKNPKQEYKRESFELFTAMLENLKQTVISVLSQIKLQPQPAELDGLRSAPFSDNVTYLHAHENSLAAPEEQQEIDGAPVETFVREAPKVGRNEPCPCGSNKKYKHCHGKLV